MSNIAILLYIFLFLNVALFFTNIFLKRQDTSVSTLIFESAKTALTKDAVLDRRFLKERKLIRYGADYFILKDNFSLQRWYLYKFLYAVVFCIISQLFAIILNLSYGYHIALAIIAFGLGYFLLDVLLYYQNKASNDAMLNDICEMSRSILYSNRGGQYITKSILDAILVVENERLKVELLKLKADIENGVPLSKAVDEFGLHFENGEISAFITVIKSLQETGQVNDALNTLRSNIEINSSALNKYKCKKLESKTQINCVMVFTGIIACLCYILFIFISNIVSGF